jgi:hypothetical protein
MKLSTIKKTAQGITRHNGHSMVWGEVFGRANGPKSCFARCRKCQSQLLIAEQAGPDSRAITGLAATTKCS